ncbi:MAG: hypothetical protein L6V89_04325 [Oscillospiraceae bacterium]|nr:MAG: hypothetical protein L6V89_04325 [Oscillospiraceae bacterium]
MRLSARFCRIRPALLERTPQASAPALLPAANRNINAANVCNIADTINHKHYNHNIILNAWRHCFMPMDGITLGAIADELSRELKDGNR